MNKDVNTILENLLVEQRKFNPTIAENLNHSRRMAIKEIELIELFKSDYDTLWMIERVDEVDLSTFSFVWTSNRDEVVSINFDTNGVTSNNYEYHILNDPLKTIVEKLDTFSIIGKESPLGAKRAFISEISQKKIRTYYFVDITYSQKSHY
ncbi:hypothetical protein [Aquiflexum sp.]|uniref:hypothetical protein n=1 Tax=Aquiflexum sp. TaxID=1872584 RepID=UPI00359436BF